jgi:hypothetical protein
MIGTIETKIESIFEKLVGRNQTLQGEVYSDDYLNRLNNMYPLIEVF